MRRFHDIGKQTSQGYGGEGTGTSKRAKSTVTATTTIKPNTRANMKSEGQRRARAARGCLNPRSRSLRRAYSLKTLHVILVTYFSASCILPSHYISGENVIDLLCCYAQSPRLRGQSSKQIRHKSLNWESGAPIQMRATSVSDSVLLKL